MKRILVLQNYVAQYRKPVFNWLGERYEVTVLHSGEVSVLPGDRYGEKIVKLMRFGPLVLQKGVLAEVQKGYDVVLVMFDVRWLANMLLLFTVARPRVVLWGHRYGKHPLVNAWRDLLMMKGDAHLLYGSEDISAMINRGIPRERIYIAPNTIYIENPLNTSAHAKTSFLFVGRLQARKRVNILLREFAIAKSRLPEHVLIEVVGDGPERAKLEKLCDDLGIEKSVRFHGALTEEKDLFPIFARAYAYVSPGAVGLGVLHAFAYGVVPVTRQGEYHGPEARSLTHGENAIIYNDHVELREALVRLAWNDEWRMRLSSNAYGRFAEERSFSKMMGGFVDAIEGLNNDNRCVREQAV